jgi:hypothetical protein
MYMNLAGRCLALGFMFAVGLFAEACAAEQRVALVIGNGAYRSVPSCATAEMMPTIFLSSSNGWALP